jgi:protein disulfide-isomerase
MLAAVVLFAAGAYAAGPPPYDESADAKAEIRAALAEAGKAHVPVLVVFGANWCPDCRVLDLAMKSGRSAALIDRDFRVVKVDVGRFDRNLDVARRYDVPVRKGIPAVAVVSAGNRVLYATREGEIADARHMGEDGLYAFFRQAANRGRAGR